MQQEKNSSRLAESIETVKQFFTGEEDIISVIKEDHKPLKQLIEVMKDSDRSFKERRQAFLEFAPLLLTHAKAEEKSLYDFGKSIPDLKEHMWEGETEHLVADQLVEEIKRTTIEDAVSAKIKVLAEAVEHHITEEENDILPDVKKKIDEAKRIALTKTYIEVQQQIIAEGQDDSPHEAELKGA